MAAVRQYQHPRKPCSIVRVAHLIGETERYVMRLAGAALVAVVALYFADAVLNDGRFFDGLVRMAQSIESGYH
jgi:hypothetical protein